MKKKSFEKLIPDDVIKIIFEYVGCLEFTKLNLINKEFNKIYKSLPKKCKFLRYEKHNLHIYSRCFSFMQQRKA